MVEQYLNHLTSAIPVLVSMFIIGHLNGWKDLSSENWFKRIKLYLNKKASWLNKWAVYTVKGKKTQTRIKQNKKKWYHFWVFTPQWKEKFPHSSKLFVWLTDFWHLMQWLQFKQVFTTAYICLHISNYVEPSSNSALNYLIPVLFEFGAAFGVGFASSYLLNKTIRLCAVK